MSRLRGYAGTQLAEPLLMCFLFGSVGCQKLLMLTLLLLLSYLKLVNTDLGFYLLDFSKPALLGCFKIRECLNLGRRGYVLGLCHACRAIDDELRCVARGRRTLHYAVDIR